MKSWNINTTPYNCPKENMKITKAHSDASNKV